MFDQVAVYTDDIDSEVKTWIDAGIESWVRDTVTALHADGGEFKAALAFNYDVLAGGIEFELIQPLTNAELYHRHYLQGMKRGDLAHMAIHLNDDGGFEKAKQLHLYKCLQNVTTIHHRNNKVGTRRYHYTIWKSRVVPFNVKLIERV